MYKDTEDTLRKELRNTHDEWMSKSKAFKWALFTKKYDEAKELGEECIELYKAKISLEIKKKELGF